MVKLLQDNSHSTLEVVFLINRREYSCASVVLWNNGFLASALDNARAPRECSPILLVLRYWIESRNKNNNNKNNNNNNNHNNDSWMIWGWGDFLIIIKVLIIIHYSWIAD